MSEFDEDKKETSVDDAFGFRPEQPDTGYNPSVPTPQMQYESRKKSDLSKRILTIILAVFAAAALFFAGFFTRQLTSSKEADLLSWALKTIDENYFGDDVTGQKHSVQDYLDAMGKGLTYEHGGPLDPYSSFYTPAELAEENAAMEGENSNYGFNAVWGTMATDTGIKNVVTVYDVIWGSDAEKQGILSGDVMERIGNTVLTEENAADVYGAMMSGGAATELGLLRPSYDAAQQKTTYHSVTVTVKSTTYNAKYLRYYERNGRGEDIAAMPELGERTAYIKFKQFQGDYSTGKQSEFDKAMLLFKTDGMENLILDLRGNGGGYLNICASIANYLVSDRSFSDNLTIATTEFKDGSKTAYRTGKNLYKDQNFKKIVVLVNGNSASASEVLLGAMMDFGTVDAIIGQNTYGKGIMQSRFTKTYKKQEYALILTVAKWYTPNGTWVQRRNIDGEEFGRIKPTIPVAANVNNYPYSAANDSELSAALQFLNGQV